MSSRSMALDVLVRLKDRLSGPLRGLRNNLDRLVGFTRRIGVLGAAIGALSFMGPIQEAAAFQQQLLDIAGTAELSGAAAFDFARENGRAYEDLALKTRLMSTDIARGAADMIAAGLDKDYIDAVIGDVAKGTKAANAEFADMASIARAAALNLKVPADEMDDVLGALVTAGKLGNFELRDMAKHFATLTPQLAKFGVTGREAVDFLGSSLQIAMKGASDPAQAANNLKNFLAKALAPDTIKRFKEAGVNIQGVMMDATAKGINPLEAVLQKIGKLTGTDGNTIGKYMADAKKRGLEGADALAFVREQLEAIGAAGKIGTLFGDQQVLDFLIPFMANVEEYKAIKEKVAAATGAALDPDFETQIAGLNSELMRLTEIGTQASRVLGGAFGKHLPMLNDGLEWLLRSFRELDASMNGWLSSGISAIGGIALIAAALGALSFVLPIVGAGLGAVGAAIALLLSPIGLMVAALAGAGVVIWKNWDRYGGRVMRLWDRAKTGFRDFARDTADKGRRIISAGREVADRFGPALAGGFASAYADIRAGWQRMRPLLDGFADGLDWKVDLSGLTIDQAKLAAIEGLELAITGIKTAWGAMKDFGTGFSAHLRDIGEAAGKAVGSVGDIARDLVSIGGSLVSIGSEVAGAGKKSPFEWLGSFSGEAVTGTIGNIEKVASGLGTIVSSINNIATLVAKGIDWSNLIPESVATKLEHLAKVSDLLKMAFPAARIPDMLDELGKPDIPKPGEPARRIIDTEKALEGLRGARPTIAPDAGTKDGVPLRPDQQVPALKGLLERVDGRRAAAVAPQPVKLAGNVTVTVKVSGPGQVTGVQSDNKMIQPAGRMVGNV